MPRYHCVVACPGFGSREAWSHGEAAVRPADPLAHAREMFVVTVAPCHDDGGRIVDAKGRSEMAEEKSVDAREKSTEAALLIWNDHVLIVLAEKIFQFAADFFMFEKNVGADAQNFFHLAKILVQLD